MLGADSLTVLNLVDSGIIVLDRHYRIAFWNKFVSDYSHIDLSNVEGKNWLDVFPMLKDSRIDKAVTKAIDLNYPSILSHKLVKQQFPLYRKSLATKPPYQIVQSYVLKPLFKNGENDGCVIYINDVSPAVKREADLHEKSVELAKVIKSYEKVKSYLAGVFSNTQSGIIIFDEAGKIINVNEACMGLYEQSESDFMSNNISCFIPDLKERFYSEKEQKYQLASGERFEFEQVFDGDVQRYFLIGFNKADIGGALSLQEKCNFFVLITDITEQKKIEEKLREVNDELEEFTYRTSHDLRSPIVSSIGLLDAAKKRMTRGDMGEMETCIDMSREGLVRLDILIKDILQLSELKGREESVRQVHLDGMIDDIFLSLGHFESLAKGDIEKRVNLEHGKPFLTKESRLRSILENLISNSIKYRDSESEQSFVEIKSALDGNHILIDVMDNGIGIPERFRSKLFSMFNRFHPDVSFGSGLGLYMTRKSARHIGGDIEFIANDDVTHFRVRIPCEFAFDNESHEIIQKASGDS